MKLNNSGSVTWAKIIKTKGQDWHSMQIDIDLAGSCYIGGTVRDSAWFDNNLVVNQGNRDLFVAKYGNDGSFKWANVFGSNPVGQTGIFYPANDIGGIAVWDTASLFISGKTWYAVQFDGTTLHSSNANGFISLSGPDVPSGISASKEAGAGLVIHPNPADDIIYFEFSDAGNSFKQDGSMEIISLGGQIISQQEFPGASMPFSINVQHLSRGMYFVKLKTGSRIITGKFIKQ